MLQRSLHQKVESGAQILIDMLETVTLTFSLRVGIGSMCSVGESSSAFQEAVCGYHD